MKTVGKHSEPRSGALNASEDGECVWAFVVDLRKKLEDVLAHDHQRGTTNDFSSQCPSSGIVVDTWLVEEADASASAHRLPSVVDEELVRIGLGTKEPGVVGG